MNYTVKQKNKVYHIVGTPYNFNNKLVAEELCNTLNQYDEIKKRNQHTDEILDKIETGIINLQMTVKILDHEISELKKITE